MHFQPRALCCGASCRPQTSSSCWILLQATCLIIAQHKAQFQRMDAIRAVRVQTQFSPPDSCWLILCHTAVSGSKWQSPLGFSSSRCYAQAKAIPPCLTTALAALASQTCAKLNINSDECGVDYESRLLCTSDRQYMSTCLCKRVMANKLSCFAISCYRWVRQYCFCPGNFREACLSGLGVLLTF